ncbi:MAG: cytochrome c biogenesis protein CcdA [Candidatus Micrarchaeota archaeon]
MAQEIALIAAFTAGLASVLSPCFLPLIPAFVSYLGGLGIGDGTGKNVSREKTMLNTLFFILGFVLVFSILGVALNGVLSAVSFQFLEVASKAAGLAIIFFGLTVLGIVRLGFLEKERKLKPMKTRYAYLTSFIFGAAFAVSWTPCVGFMLAAIFALAASQPGSSFLLLFLYSLGLAAPFAVTGAFTAQVSDFIRMHNKAFALLNKLMGVILVVMGILVLTGNFAKLAEISPTKCIGIG